MIVVESSRGARLVVRGLLIALMLVPTIACGNSDNASPGVAAGSSVDEATFEFTIPVGAGEALDAGEPLEILPETLEARVGESIRIVNNDDRGHSVGPFFVGARETMTQVFASPGEFTGVCTVHPSGEFALVVRA